MEARSSESFQDKHYFPCSQAAPSATKITRTWKTDPALLCPASWDKQRAAQVLTFTGGVAPVPECRRIWQPFWLGLCCLLLSCGFFTVPPWSFLTDSTFSAVVLLNSLFRDKPIKALGLCSTQNVTGGSGLEGTFKIIQFQCHAIVGDNFQ